MSRSESLPTFGKRHEDGLVRFCLGLMVVSALASALTGVLAVSGLLEPALRICRVSAWLCLLLLALPVARLMRRVAGQSVIGPPSFLGALLTIVFSAFAVAIPIFAHAVLERSVPRGDLLRKDIRQGVVEASAKLRLLDEQRTRLLALLMEARRVRDQRATVLRDMGIESSQDLGASAEANKVAEALRLVSADVESLQLQVDRRDQAIAEAQSILRRLEAADVLGDEDVAQLMSDLRAQVVGLDGGDPPVSGEELDPIEQAGLLDKAIRNAQGK
jgi:hypothetical protein